MNARTFGGPADSFSKSAKSTHLLAARPGQIAKSQQWDLIAFPTAQVTIRAEVVLVKIVPRTRSQRVLPRGRKDRITGSYRRNLSSREAVDRSIQIPSILIASVCLGMLLSILTRCHLFNLQCHPPYYMRCRVDQRQSPIRVDPCIFCMHWLL